MTDLIKVENQDFSKGKLFTTSLIMAERFDKPHNDLLKIIRNVIEDSEGFNVGRFSLVKYTDKKGEERPYYQLDKDAFMLVVMHIKGRKAMQIKAEFIKAFNRMEDVIKLRVDKIPAYKIENRNYNDFIKFSISGENPADHFVKWSFKIYKDLIYKKALGETAGQRRKRLHMKEGGNVANTLEIEEIDAINHWMHIVRDKVLDEGWIKLKPKDAYVKVKEWLETI